MRWAASRRIDPYRDAARAHGMGADYWLAQVPKTAGWAPDVVAGLRINELDRTVRCVHVVNLYPPNPHSL
jgi:hypothetical protein